MSEGPTPGRGALRGSTLGGVPAGAAGETAASQPTHGG